MQETFTQWKNTPNESIRLIAFGSSNTELGWHSEGGFNWFSWLSTIIRTYIGKHIACINQGIGGEKVTDLEIRLKRDVLSFSPHAVIITIGGNDANRGVPLEKYQSSLRNLVIQCQEVNIQPILQTYYCPSYRTSRNHHSRCLWADRKQRIRQRYHAAGLWEVKCLPGCAGHN